MAQIFTVIIFVVSVILYNFAFGNKNIAVQTICPKTLIASNLHFQNPIIQ